jgi:hypothetical protein
MPMKRAMVVWLGFAGMAFAGKLTFPEPVKELAPGPDESKVKVDFPFTNNTDKTVVVKETLGDCSCTSIEISGGKTAYEPGESGVIRLNFDIGAAVGKVEKGASIWVDGDPKDAPSQRLTMKVDIPILVEMEPKTLKWQVGQEMESKTIKFKMLGDKAIHIKSVTSSTEHFTQELKTIEDGRSYELLVTPKNINNKALAVFRVETDCEVPKHRTQQVFAVVSAPVAK